MKLFLGKPRTGKTYQIIKQASETGAYIVTFNRQEADRIFNESQNLGFNIRFPISYDEFMQQKMRSSRVRNIIIDNADIFLQQLASGLDIEAITITDGDTEFLKQESKDEQRIKM